MIRDEELRTRLEASFRLEVTDILKEFRADLEKLGTFPPDRDPSGLLEGIHRLCHSLKGAARTVEADQIQILGQALEDLFVRWKEKRVNPDERIFNALYQAADMIEQLVFTESGKTNYPLPDLIDTINGF